jgi:hypothetical protein
MISKLKWLIKLVTVFFLFFDTNFKFAPGFTSARCAFLGLLIVVLSRAIISKKKISRSFLKEHVYFLVVLSFVFFFAAIQYFFSNDITQIARLTYFTIFALITPFLLLKVIRTRKEFLLMIGIAVTIQSVLTLSSYFIPSVKNLFVNLILYNANFSSEFNLRALGFVSVAGATFSVIQFTGVVALLIVIRNYSLSYVQKILSWIAIVITLLAILFIGRTGLFLSLVAIAVFVLSYTLSLKRILITCSIFFLATQINYKTLLEGAASDIEGYNMDFFFAWIESGFQLKNDLVEGLSEMPIPPLSLRTIIGTGLVADPNGDGNASGHDSGYIQSYYSLGLILAILFYFSYFLYLFLQARINKETIGYLLVLVLILIESKEFFVFSYVYPMFLLSFLLIGRSIPIQTIFTKK